MEYKDVYTQKEMLKAIEESFIPVLRGNGEFEVLGSAQVTAYGQAQVTAYGQAQVTAYGQAQVRAFGSAQVTATGSAQVTAYSQAQVTAYGQAQVRAATLGGGFSYCPVCGNEKRDGHAPDCEISKALEAWRKTRGEG